MTELISRESAKNSGIKKYFTGDACGRGHVAERFVSSRNCCVCTNANRSEWRKANIEKNLAQARASFARNKDKRHAEHKAWRERNKEKQIARCAEWRAANIEDIRSRERSRYAENKSVINLRRSVAKIPAHLVILRRNRAKAWAAKNLDKRASYERTRRARKKGCEGTHTAEEVLVLARKQKYKCATCKVSIKDGYHADHVMPIKLGGDNWISNIQLLCVTCNCRKSAKHPVDWARENGLLV